MQAISINKSYILIFGLLISLVATAQQKQVAKPKANALPATMYKVMQDSCTSLDIVFLTGKGGSMSLEGRNVKFFTSFLSTKAGEKRPNATQDGTLMWEQNGKEYLSGAMYFTSDSSGYIQFARDNKEYVNALTPQGAGFLHTHGK